ncbi:uncharacterized protein LOC132279468 [Cornus florida]|uniref:uncharacterized protein LOC132279468 n=1 Tax=Cornus florida TaxID=4283 RepID=UPI00289E316F|nr:uncharacterized protein LOC132279468 [Cornus florida]
MLFTVASAFMYAENRQLVEVFPENVRKVWNEWELRVMMLLSLTLQIILVLLGARRKYVCRTSIRIILWSAYLMADWVAIVALGIISRTYTTSQQQCETTPAGGVDMENATNELMSFWAPFLLLHLGGPDTITAYSLEDNELWLRHLLGLVVQTAVALYIFLMAWPGCSWFPVLSILVLNAGLIKYGERTWSLRCANSEHLRDSMLTPPDSGPNYAKFMEEFTLKAAEGFHVGADEVIETPVPADQYYPNYPDADGAGVDKFKLEAYRLFQTFKRLFVDLILSFQDRDKSQSYFRDLTSKDAFHVIEVELGFAFDILYTKAPVVYTVAGCMLRLVSFSSTLWALIFFVALSDKDSYHKIDLAITYLLMVVALLLEIYAAIVMLDSDWTDYYLLDWLSRHSKSRNIFSCLRQSKKQYWWSNSIAQYNLLSFCLGDKPPICHGVQKLLRINEFREKHRYKTYKNLKKDPFNLKELIFTHQKEFTSSSTDHRPPKAEGQQSTGEQVEEQKRFMRGSFVLRKYNNFTSIDWAIDMEFDQSILIWHIATDLCYYTDGVLKNPDLLKVKESSKQISDYMLYLLVMCPSLLPMGIGMIRFRDTCAEAKEFFEERNTISKHGFNLACKKLLDVNTKVWPIKVKGDRSKSVLFDACRLAKSLKDMKETKWEFVSKMWVENLGYAATHCNGHRHAQQLRKGGELLTHVWLLMAHLGITEQFQITKGHARAKLIVK